MCDVSPYVQPRDDADVRRADAMTVSPAAEAPRGGTNPMKRQGGSTAMAKVDYADARKLSELSGVGSHKTSSGFDVVEGSDGRRAKKYHVEVYVDDGRLAYEDVVIAPDEDTAVDIAVMGYGSGEDIIGVNVKLIGDAP